jgi:hypothetical protein
MPGIIFGIAQMLQELESARKLTRAFTQNGDHVFSQLKTQLESLQDESSPQSVDWGIPRSTPLRSIQSAGEHEIGGRGIHVFAEFSFVWHIKRIPRARRKEPAKEFQIRGVASTVARIFEVAASGTQGAEIAMWRIEIGDDNSPGCHFHMQILGEENDGPFPKRLSVPRFPTCLTSPMAALEFLLAELFQEKWQKNVSYETDALRSWRAIQRQRLGKLLDWQSKTVSELNHVSPWSALKFAKPPVDIFVV